MLLSLQATGSNFTMPYAEIGASLQQKYHWSIVVLCLLLLLLNLLVFETLLADDN